MASMPDIRAGRPSRKRSSAGEDRARPVILACDTSTTVGSVALVEGGVVTGETLVKSLNSHSLRILKDIEALLATRGLSMDSIDAFVTAGGPGSFTGVRIAMSTMKGLAWTTKRPLIAIGSLDALARPLLGRDMPALVALDAKRQEVYAALFDHDGAILVPPAAMSPVTAAALAGEAAGDRRIICAGEGIEAFAAVFSDRLQARMVRAAPWEDLIRASVLGVIGTSKFLEGDFADVQTVEPVYLRRSEAEINLEKATSANRNS